MSNATALRESEPEDDRQAPVGDNSAAARAAATPMMAQFLEIKAANADSLLFYRMGDFYELFFDDAEIASRALGITLTKRGKHAGQDIPMCGVPVHAADEYLQRLIALGHRVAVCEQLEDPAEAKKRGSKAVVRRDVTRLVTPATITEDTLLEPGETSWLVSVGRAKGDGNALALAWIDISTGAFHIGETTAQTLVADIARIAPREIIVADTVFHDGQLGESFQSFGRMVQPQPATLFDSAAAAGRLSRFYGVSTMDGIGDFSRAELSAAAGAIAYVEKTQINERPALQRPQRDTLSATLFVDAATRANLEIDRTLSGQRDGSLLKAIDRTVSGPGARLLAERIRAPLTDATAINDRLDAISFALANERLGSALRSLLKSAPDMARALSRLSVNRGSPRDLGAIREGLSVGGDIYRRLEDQNCPSSLEAARNALADIPAKLLASLNSALGDELPMLARDGGFVREGHDSELDRLRALSRDSRQVIASLQSQYAEETGVKSLKIRFNNVLGYFIEVTALNAPALTSGEEAKGRFIHRQTMANAMRFTTTELADLESRIANASGQALAIELAVFERLKAEVVDAAEEIRRAAQALAMIDVTTALAELAAEQGYCRPIVDETGTFKVTAGRHPVVEQALRSQAADPFVANDCDLSPPQDHPAGAIWLLTGPNMGGKSTFLRQNALIAILAQSGSFVPAGAAHIGVVDRLFSRVGASDDLARGRSTFMVEMVETAAILNQAGPRSLVILDEIGRGTATFDGLSIAWAALEHLHETNGCRTLFATHFHELTALSNSLPRLANVTMQVREWEGDVVFLHQVAPGSADRSYGIQVARLAGLPHDVVSRARAVLEQLEAQGQGHKAAAIIDDLPLFSATPARAAPAETSQTELRKAVDALLPDEMTPREALDALYELKHVAETNK